MKSSLSLGTTISHYRLLSLLGAGGMGEVYKAEDTILGRTIALKILPHDLVRNEERVQRFVQEARSASSLSHPHIITVHEIGQATVQPAGDPEAGKPSESSIRFIAMEYVDGATLGAKIHDEKQDLRALLVYLAQVAEGLAKAHAAGIVHRDLKPDNIMISRDGYAKVLDFGLAKLRGDSPAGENPVGVTTAARAPTREGTVLGTVAYMAPEQVQGKAADSRADIFSFGCILYESATRERPFQGDSDIDVMHKILHAKPTAVDQLNPSVPAELIRIIRRCLAKDPDQRFQSMKDLAIELRDIAEEFDQLSPASSLSSRSSIATTPLPPVGRRRGFWIGAGAAGLVTLGALVFVIAMVNQRQKAQVLGTSAFHSMKINSLTGSGKVRAAAISPDGKVVVHAIEEGGKQSLWVRQVATGSDVAIVPSGPPFRGVAITPDGNYVYYTRSEREFELYSLLFQVPVLGGPTRKLLFDVDTPVTFSPDGKQIAFTRGYPQKDECAVMIAQADGTGERPIAIRKDPEEYLLTVAAWSPDGKTIAAVASSLEGGTHSSVVAIDVSDGSEHRFDAQRWNDVNGLAWLPDGSGLVVVASTKESGPIHQIWLLNYPGGGVRRITNDLNNYQGASLTADSRMLVTVQINLSSNLCLAPAEGAAASVRELAWERNEFVEDVRWSAAGPIVFLAGRNESFDLWMCDAEGGKQKRLTTESLQYFDPVLASDGTFILCTSVRNGGIPHVWKLDADGGNPTQLTQGAGEQLADLSADDRWLIYRTIGQQDAVWRMPVAGGEPVEIAKAPRGDVLLSRDGEYVCLGYHREEGNRMVLALGIRPATGGELAYTYDLPDGIGERQWAPSSDAVTYSVTRDGVSNIWRQPLGEVPAQQMTDFKSGRIFSFDWSPDGKQLAFSRGETVGDVVLLSDFR